MKYFVIVRLAPLENVCYGPFDSNIEAREWANGHILGSLWLIAEHDDKDAVQDKGLRSYSEDLDKQKKIKSLLK